MTDGYQEGETVWFVHKRKLEMYECVIQKYIDGYYYAFANIGEDTVLMPIHVDNLRDDEEVAKRELFKLRLMSERTQDD